MGMQTMNLSLMAFSICGKGFGRDEDEDYGIEEGNSNALQQPVQVISPPVLKASQLSRSRGRLPPIPSEPQSLIQANTPRTVDFGVFDEPIPASGKINVFPPSTSFLYSNLP